MLKKTMYPTSITQPNENKSSGLAGVHFKEIRRDGKVHIEKLRDLNDPKYFHKWKNTSNLKKGKTANCGNRSSYHCSHSTYYGIKGYRNTCPIAGVTGTYTQPAKLRLEFDPKDKGISSSAIIKSVTITFKHRCVGVDVSNDKIYTSWGPNFSGFNHYPNRKVLEVNFAGQTKYWNKNPPLSEKKYDTVSLTFKSTSNNKIKYSDLTKHMDLQYGNNLSTNPGNIYIKDLEIEVEYEEGKPYIEGKQSSKDLYISDCPDCKSSITFTLEVGYKEDGKKINPSKAQKILQNNKLTYSIPSFENDNTLTSQQKQNCVSISRPNDGKTIKVVLTDPTTKEGKKEIKFKVKGAGEISFQFKTKKRPKPKITIPSSIEKNTAPKGVTSIVAENGCTCTIKAYDNEYKDENLLYTFSNLKLNNTSNIIPQTDVDNFYKVLSRLSCGTHRILFKRGNEPLSEMTYSDIIVSATDYKLKFYEVKEEGEETEMVEIFEKINLIQNKEDNKQILLEYVKTKDLLEDPVFHIINPTFGLNQSPLKISEDPIVFNPNKEGGITPITIGTYIPGKYLIAVQEPENCLNKQTNLIADIESNHKQHFDEIFVRGEDSTAFDYDYLVALEGDTVQEPIKVEAITLKNSFKDIKICTSPSILSNINKPDSIPIKVTNKTDEDIENVFLELNVLAKNEDGDFEVSTGEWIDEEGAFYNFEGRFNEYNKDLSNILSIKNLSSDNDEVDEEDVYIHIKKIYAGQTIDFEIPFFSYLEKELKLQILLFGEPMALYNILNCSSNVNPFNSIDIGIYDAILTDMSISGNVDIFTPQVDCPCECFDIDGVNYRIKNIDTSDLDVSKTIIRNDPRLKPYKILNKEGEEIDISSVYRFGNRTEFLNMNGIKVSNTVKFPNYPDIILKGFTDTDGYVTFYITIPKTIGRTFTVNELKTLCTFNINNSQSSYKVIPDTIEYGPGQTVPMKIKVTSEETYLISEIDFYPNITHPGDYDQITVYYRVCNLENNEGILKTRFETDPENHKMITNKIEEDILCGVPTNLNIKSHLNKVTVEQTQYNRLSLVIENKDRFNKDIKIHITEKEDVIKYSYFSHNIDIGELDVLDGEIIWKINYMEKDSKIKGYIDFRGDVLGLSSIEIESEDFVSNIEFNKKNC